ncbi:MAG: tetratricopeptide repeat protein [Chitinophagales bacterium]
MKQFFSITCICVLSLHASGQQNKIDSILTLLKNDKEDTNQVGHLNSLAYDLKSNNPDTAIYFARKALALASKLNFKIGIGNAYFQIGAAKINLGNFDDALKNSDSALQIYNELLTSEKSVGKSNILKQKANAYNNIGVSYWCQGNYPEALKNHLAALKIREEIEDKQGIASSYGNIGTVYKSQRNYTEALKNYFAALGIMQQIGNKPGIAATYNNIGIIYFDQGNYSEALKNSSASLEIKKQLGDKEAIAKSYTSIGNIYDGQGNYPGALQSYFATLKIMNEIGDKDGIAKTYINIANIYAKQKNASQASQYLNKGLAIAKEIGSLEGIMATYSSLAELDAAHGNYKQGLEHYKLFITYRDSIFNEKKTQKLVQTEMQYEFAKKEDSTKAVQEKKDILEAAALQNQKLQKYFSFGVAILLIILAVVLFNRYRLRQSLQLQKIRNKISSDLHDDIGSTLSSIAIYSELANEEVKEKSIKATSLLKSINENSRSAVESMSDIVWAINPKNDRFENILQRMRTFASGILEAKNIELVFRASASLSELKLSLEKRKNLYLIFKEAVNNAAKYSGCRNCSIRLWLEGKILNMEIADDGSGFDTNHSTTGNGLVNMRKRSEEMQSHLDVQSTMGKGTTVKLSLSTT